MDKPISLSVKQFLIRKMSVYMAVPEKTVEAVVNHQFASMLDAMQTEDSVELSGFGKFLFNKKKAARMMEKHLANKQLCEEALSKDMSPQQMQRFLLRLATLNENIDILKPRIDGDTYKGDNRRMEKPSDSSRASKGTDHGSFEGKA